MKKNIVILHGWGLKGSTYKDLIELFDGKKYSVYAPDLPGFGKEPLESESMNLQDYVDFVKKYLMKKKIKSAIFIGHSFGGRVAAKLGSEYPEMVEKVVFTGTPIIRQLSAKQKVAALAATIGGIVLSKAPQTVQHISRKLLYRSIGEYDYFKAGRLKKTLHNIVNEDLTMYTKKLSMPVFLAWGEKDTFTPSGDVEKIKKLIPSAKSKIVKDTGHRLPYANPDLFIEAVKGFI